MEKKTAVDAFRESARDVLALLAKLPVGSVEELRGLLELAMDNDAQAAILIAAIKRP